MTRIRPAIRSLVCIALVVAAMAFTVPGGALQEQTNPDELESKGLLRLDAIEGGALLFETDEPGWYVPAPALLTDIDITVSGPIARGVVSQTFRNVADVFVDGKYVFPLPEGAAVDTLRMRVADRWIEGTVEEKEEALEIFQEAKEAGQVASLVEQERPNVFTTSIANIAPGADIVVQIEYQQSLAPRNGVFGLRVPLVVAPRFVPADQLVEELTLTSGGWTPSARPNAEASRVTPPVVDPRTEPDGTIRNPVEISIDLDAGFPLGPIDSPYHDVDIVGSGANPVRIEVDGPVPANRDFYLSWAPQTLDEPYAAAFTEDIDGDTHFVTMITPPAAEAIGDTRQPREVIFVQDTSGSMAGTSIQQARAGLVLALQRLEEDDWFNIFEFNSEFTVFERDAVPATPANIARAVTWVENLGATGGTNMLPALRTALRDSDSDDGRLRQVIFLTDGAVSNELQMLELIERDLGASRLFTVGIGSAPNSYFMTAAARTGRGSFVFIGDLSEVSNQMQALFAKIETPAVVKISVDGFSADAEVSPFPIPDLYAGDPIVLTIRVPEGVETGDLRLVGQRGDEDWSMAIDLDGAEDRPGVSKLWARERIRDLEALWRSPEIGTEERDAIDAEILALALEFDLVTRLTSLVAVDVEVTRPADETSTETEVPTNLPSGWDPEIFFRATNASDVSLSVEALERLGLAGDQLLEPQGLGFAATGGDWQFRAMLGLALTALGAVVFFRTSDRQREDSPQ